MRHLPPAQAASIQKLQFGRARITSSICGSVNLAFHDVAVGGVQQLDSVSLAALSMSALCTTAAEGRSAHGRGEQDCPVLLSSGRGDQAAPHAQWTFEPFEITPPFTSTRAYHLGDSG